MPSREPEGLSKEEDDSLRRLAYLAKTAGGSDWTKDRIEVLRSRDRRKSIREPRETSIGDEAAKRNQAAAASKGTGGLVSLLGRRERGLPKEVLGSPLGPPASAQPSAGHLVSLGSASGNAGKGSKDGEAGAPKRRRRLGRGRTS